MNVVLDYLSRDRERLDLDARGVPPLARAVLLTPRFRTSSHIVFLLLPERGSEPALVAKLPRRGGMSPALGREAAALEAIRSRQAAEPGTVPELVAYDSHRGHALLIETALVGAHLHRAAVRRDVAGAVEAASDWLLEAHRRSASSSKDDTWFERLVSRPLDRLEESLGASGDAVRLIGRTRELAETLRGASLPLVLVHGDFAHPNLIRLPGGRLGVIDWELGEMGGLPAGDLFLFLAYAALARDGSHRGASDVPAAHAALCGDRAWARPVVHRYFRAAGLDRAWLGPLFALAFARSLAGLLDRTGGEDANDNGASGESDPGQINGWLRTDRRYALWEHAVVHAGHLD